MHCVQKVAQRIAKTQGKRFQNIGTNLASYKMTGEVLLKRREKDETRNFQRDGEI